MRGGKKRRMTDGGRGRACLSARELIRAGVCVHLTELLLLDELVDLGIGILEGLEGLGEDGFMSREGSGTSSVPMKPMGGGGCCVCSGPIDRWPRGRVSDRTASSTAKPGSGRFVAARDRGNGTRTIFALIRNLARGFRAGRSRARGATTRGFSFLKVVERKNPGIRISTVGVVIHEYGPKIDRFIRTIDQIDR